MNGKLTTRLPYRYRVEGEGDVLWNVYYGHPPERLTGPMVRAAVKNYKKDKIDKHLRGLRKQVRGHSYAAFLTKLVTIDSLASANGKDIPSIVASSLMWIRRESPFGNLDHFLTSATPADAESMMTWVGEEAGGCRSLLSKYLAYHNANRWMIYDSFVRCYLWATYCGIQEKLHQSHDGRQALEITPIQKFADLENYQVYFDTVHWTWRMLGLPTSLRARTKEYVLWHRARNCRISRWEAPKKRKDNSLADPALPTN